MRPREASSESITLLEGVQDESENLGRQSEASGTLEVENGAGDVSKEAVTLRGVLRVCNEIKLQLFFVGVYGFVSLAKNVTFFPFVRTTMSCDSGLGALDHDDPLWSGSLHCNDVQVVARKAQLLKGWSEGLDQGFHCLMLPFLGHAIDCFGRRWGVLVGMSGVFLQCVFFLLASLGGFGIFSHAMIICGSIIQGMTGVFMGAVTASVRDLQIISNDDAHRHESHAFGALQASQGLFASLSMVFIVSLVITKNLENYNFVWLFFSAMAAAATLLGFFLFPETLLKLSTWNWKKASPLSLVDLFTQGETQKWVALMVFFQLLSLSSLSTLQAYTVAKYGWSQTRSTVVFLILAPLPVLSLAASFILIPKLGPYRYIEFSQFIAALGVAVLGLADFGSFYAFLGLAFIVCTMGSFPAITQVITGLAREDEVGQLLSNIGAIALAAVAIGNIFFATVFHGQEKVSSMPFVSALPLILIACWCAIKARRSSKK